ncbi:hypothetical protein LSAT2_018823 [Lamellibrachia satsuma]|nr:hypothetical protein LSAT2_018823 [Lamellibrachia satsuma]
MIVNTTSRTWRSVVNTSCGNDKMFANRAKYRVLTCTSNGEWWPDIMGCVDRVAPPKYSPVVKEAAHSEVIGAVALGLVIAAVGAVVAADVPALLMAFHRLRDNFAAQ